MESQSGMDWQKGAPYAALRDRVWGDDLRYPPELVDLPGYHVTLDVTHAVRRSFVAGVFTA